ncbi:MAG: CoA pyrophosphatase [bacterium]|nr:CoA pyrophosphatase [bacterium]
MDTLVLLRSRLRTAVPRDLPSDSPPSSFRRAAVLVPLFESGGAAYLLLTKRTEKVEYHKGQISFPGGRQEDGDADLLETALRETHEEIGLAPSAVEVWGRLDEIEVIASGFAVTPFVGLVPPPVGLRPNPDEIAEIVAVPLASFLDPANLRVEHVLREGRSVELVYYENIPHLVWGATARIIKGLVELLAPESPPGGER